MYILKKIDRNNLVTEYISNFKYLPITIFNRNNFFNKNLQITNFYAY